MWYRSLLSGDEAEAYDGIRDGVLSLEREIRVPRMEYRTAADILAKVKLDDPGIFWVRGHSVSFRAGAEHMNLSPEYIFPVKQIPEMKKQLGIRLDRLLRPAYDLDPVRAVGFVRSFIFNNVKYEKVGKSYSHEIYGILSHGIGVCEGIAKTVKLMLDRLSVGSVVAVGSENDENIRHAWNLIELHGRMRHYDMTYDLSRMNAGLKPVYAGMTDDMIYKDHNRPVYELPECR